MPTFTSVTDNQIDLFIEPARLLLAGNSGSGKSWFISRLINKYKDKFKTIVIVGSDLENIDSDIVTRRDSFNPLIDDFIAPLLIVYDDILYNKKLVENASETFIRGRHLNISSIFLSQNLYYNDKNYRVISMNCTHVILFRIRCLKQISLFASGMLSDSLIDSFKRLYKRHVLKNKYSYLLIDFNKDIDNDILAIRTNVVDDSQYESAFQI